LRCADGRTQSYQTDDNGLGRRRRVSFHRLGRLRPAAPKFGVRTSNQGLLGKSHFTPQSSYAFSVGSWGASPHCYQLHQILEQFLGNLYCMDASSVCDETTDQLPSSSQLGKTRVGGIDVSKPRMRAILRATPPWPVPRMGLLPGSWRTEFDRHLALSGIPNSSYDSRSVSLRHQEASRQRAGQQTSQLPPVLAPPPALSTIAALVIIREKLLCPILAGVRKITISTKPRRPTTSTTRLSAETCSPLCKT
jgi:hypothetical protein